MTTSAISMAMAMAIARLLFVDNDTVQRGRVLLLLQMLQVIGCRDGDFVVVVVVVIVVAVVAAVVR